MADVEFNEPSFETAPRAEVSREPSRISKTIIALGLATDEKGAQRVLIAAALVCLAIAGAAYLTMTPSGASTPAVTAPVTP